MCIIITNTPDNIFGTVSFHSSFLISVSVCMFVNKFSDELHCVTFSAFAANYHPCFIMHALYLHSTIIQITLTRLVSDGRHLCYPNTVVQKTTVLISSCQVHCILETAAITSRESLHCCVSRLTAKSHTKENNHSREIWFCCKISVIRLQGLTESLQQGVASLNDLLLTLW